MEGINNETIVGLSAECRRRRRRRSEEVKFDIGFADLPDFILLEILYRLPVKSIFRFKCVSKVWLSTISDPLVARSYNRRLKHTSSAPWTLLFRYPYDQLIKGKIPPDHMRLQVALNKHQHPHFKSPNFTLDFLSTAGEIMKVVAATNGLLLSCATAHCHELYYICNPLTKQWVALPPPPRIHKWVSVGFLVEPNDGGSYQVVRIPEFRGSSNVVNLEILSSKSGEWRDKRLSFDFLVRMFTTGSTQRPGLAFKGILHWMELNNRIIVYDPSAADEDKCCRLIDLPENRETVQQGVLGLSQSQHSLRYFDADNFSPSRNLSVWVLKDYNTRRTEKWCLLYRIRLNEVWSPSTRVRTALSSSRVYLQPLAIHPLNSDVVYLGFSYSIASLNFRSRRLEFPYHIYPGAWVASWTVFPFVLPPWPTPVPQTSSKAI